MFVVSAFRRTVDLYFFRDFGSCTRDRIALFCHGRCEALLAPGIYKVKKAVSSPSTPRRQRRVVQYAVLIVGCILVVDALVGDKGLIAMIKARQQYRALAASLDQVRAENARLREEAIRLREDPAAIEELARRDFGYIRPGEKLFILKDLSPTDPAAR